MMLFQFLVHILVLHFYSSKILAEEHVIMHAGNFDGNFKEIRLPNGTKVGGVPRLKTELKKCGTNCTFIYHCNVFDETTGKDSARIDHSIKVLKLLNPSAIALGPNEYNTSIDVVKRFRKEFVVLKSNIGYDCPDPNNVSGINFLGFADKTRIEGMPGLPPNTPCSEISFFIKCSHYKKQFIVIAGCFNYKQLKGIQAQLGRFINVILNTCSPEIFWNPLKPAPENTKVYGNYPELWLGGKGQILMAQVSNGTKFLGKLTLKISGTRLESYKSEMLYMYSNIPQDPEVLAIVDLPETELTGVIGKAAVFLSGDCKKRECNLGNLIADAFVQYKSDIYRGNHWTDTPIAVIAAGFIKGNIDPSARKGEVTAEDVMMALPDDDNLVTLKITGADIKRTIEFALEERNKEGGSDAFLQVSGLRIVYNSKKSRGQKLITIKVRCDECHVPSFVNVKGKQEYKIVTTEKLANGSFGHVILKYQGHVAQTENITAQTAVCHYIHDMKMVYTMNSDRIVRRTDTSTGTSQKPAQLVTWGMGACIFLYKRGIMC